MTAIPLDNPIRVSIPLPATLGDLLQILNTGPGESITKPAGGYRTKRCQHGFRCDGEEWLCENCRPSTPAEAAAKRRQFHHVTGLKREQRIARSKIRELILASCAKGNPRWTSTDTYAIRELTEEIRAARGNNQTTGSVASAVYRMRRDGLLDGFRVVKRGTNV